MDRRTFLANSLYGTGAWFMGYGPQALADGDDLNIFVIMLKGGMDGIAAVQPKQKNRLLKIRKDCLIKGGNALDSDFDLHPKLSNFHKIWRKNNAGIVHASGFDYDGRSHFDGQNIMEGGYYKPYGGPSGWLGRAMELRGFSSLALDLPVPLICKSKALTTNYYPSKFQSTGTAVSQLVNSLWEGDTGLEAVRMNSTATAASFSRKRDAEHLAAEVARQMSKEGGPKVGVVEYSGFDTHAQQGSDLGEHAGHLEKVDKIIKAFQRESTEVWNKTIVMTVTEFGRTVRQNGTRGTDHGIATAILLAGGAISNSKVIADWPGLEDKELVINRDLRQTIDARDVYGDVLHRAFGLKKSVIKEKVFPGSQQRLDLGLFS